MKVLDLTLLTKVIRIHSQQRGTRGVERKVKKNADKKKNRKVNMFQSCVLLYQEDRIVDKSKKFVDVNFCR